MSEPRFDEREIVRLAGETPVAAASPEARERARRAFVEGRSDLRGGEAAPTARPTRRAIVPLAAAAAFAIVAVLAARPTESWVLLQSAGDHTVGGELLAPGDGFGSGTVVTSDGGTVEVQLGSALRVLIPPGTRVELPAGPGRWLGRERVLRVREGEIFATSGGRPLGFRLAVESPEALTRIRGTTFAVRRNELGTCVCLLEGAVVVESTGGERSVDLAVGTSVQFFHTGDEPMTAPLSDEERTMLEALAEQGLAGEPR